jgi:TRAP transporter TAXI family solute receptor
LKVLGISPEISYGSFDAMTTELFDGRLDAFTTLTGAPMPAVQQAEAKEPVTFISPSAEQIEAIRKAMPEFSRSTIAAGTYSSLDKDCVTVGVYNFAIGRADLPDDLVYQLVKAVFDNQPRLMKATLTAKDTVPQNVDKTPFCRSIPARSVIIAKSA